MSRRRLAASLAWLAPVLGVVAFCVLSCGDTAPAGPPEVRYGLDECSRCRMIVSVERHAAAARGPAGEEARFDDLGCLARYLEERGEDGWRAWVHGLDGSWLRYAEAHLARDGDGSTPMGSGLHAFPTEVAARRFARERDGSYEGPPR